MNLLLVLAALTAGTGSYVINDSWRMAPPQPDPAKTINFDEYHDWTAMETYLVSMNATYPDCFHLTILGWSHENRTLYKVEIGDRSRPKEKAVWIDAGTHAREWISPATGEYLINELTLACDRSETSAYTSVDWIILPMVNPDGYAYTHSDERMWRKNRRPADSGDDGGCVGVDLNRNFGTPNEGFGVGASSYSCSETYKGPRGDSEPEVEAFVKAMNEARPRINTAISLHSFGQSWLTSYGYTTERPEDHDHMIAWGKKCVEEIEKASKKNRTYSVEPAGTGLYVAGGASDDFAKYTGIKFVATVELPPSHDGQNNGHKLSADEILSVGEEFYGGLKCVAEVAANPDHFLQSLEQQQAAADQDAARIAAM